MAGAQFTIPLIVVIPGQLITASLWNNEWQNLATNLNPSGLDGYSDTDAQMQIQTAPYPSNVTSHASTTGGEIERIRFQISAILGTTTPAFWYAKPPTDLTTIYNAITPIGAIIDYPSATPPSANFLIANGQAIGRTAYANLFGLIGTTFGTGDGTTTFNIPNLTDKMTIAAGNLYALAATGGQVSQVLTDPGHNHTQNSHTHTDAGHTHSTPNHQHVLNYTRVANGSNGVSGDLFSTDNDGAPLGQTNLPPGSSNPYRHLFQNQTTSGGGSTTGTGNASINSITATNNSNTTGITPLTIPTLPPYVGLYKMMRVL